MFKNLRERLFAAFWQGQAPQADEKLRALKSNLFRGVRGRVLEIGPGTGVNFKYFPAGIEWIGIEPNRDLQEVLRAHPSKPADSMLLARIEDMQTDNVDTVVSSLVLCSVPNLDTALREIRRVLRPEGMFLCVEHVAAPQRSVRRVFQRLIKPLSRHLGGGCEPDREIAAAINRTGFTTVKLGDHNVRLIKLPFNVPVISCLAVK